ncbi:MAG: hypothetical protein Q9166_005773 [cf. Caloplaca sp. 2 TL-2023]
MSFREFARKKFMRKKSSNADQTLLKNFENETSKLKGLSHEHLVKVVGSYTDQTSVAFLMDPVADMNLMTFLQRCKRAGNDWLPALRRYFGCLANAVSYLHIQKIRHRDLKPENILIKNFNVYITDFGTARDWSQATKDTTTDSNVPSTARYMAPEVANRTPKNSASDMWSLGVIYLEMITVLRGQSLNSMRTFMEKYGTRHPFVWANAPATTQWFEQLRLNGVGPDSDNEPLTWIKDLTQPDPQRRPRPWALTDQIRNTAPLFIGICCADEDETYPYPSPPSTDNGEAEQDQVLLDEQFEALGAFERPFGSLVPPSRQSSVEEWLGVGNTAADADFCQPMTPLEDGISEEPEGIVEMASVETMTVPMISQDLPVVEDRIIERCEGFDIVEDDSDDGEDNEQIGYEVIEDSSGSERTVRLLSPPLADRCALPSPPTYQADEPNGKGWALPCGTGLYDSASHSESSPPGFARVNTAVWQPALVPEAQEQPQSPPQPPQPPVEGTAPDTMHAIPGHPAMEPEAQEFPRSPPQPTRPPAKPKKPSHRSRRITQTPATHDTGTEALTARNLAQLNSDASQEVVPLSSPRKPDHAKPKMTAEFYMQEVWEAATTIETSVMSVRTRKALSGVGPLAVWQDRSVHYVEQFAKAGKAAAVHELLSGGCNPGTKKKPNYRPLINAVRAGTQRHNKVVRELLDFGADVDAVHPATGKTALHFAIENSYFPGYTNLIRNLLEHAANPNALDKNGDSPLLQILYGGYGPLEKHKRDALACLLQPHLDVDVNVMPPGTLNMPIHLAVRRQDAIAVGLLLHKGSNVNDRNGAGATPLRIAATSWKEKTSDNDMELLKYLLEAGANVTEIGGDMEDTPLHLAASQGCEQAVELLLDGNADPHVNDKQGRTPAQAATANKSKISKAAYAAIQKKLRRATRSK